MTHPVASSSNGMTFGFLNSQVDVIKQKKTLKLHSLKHHLPEIPIHDIIAFLFQFLNSFDPPLEVEKLSLSGNNLDNLPTNFKLLTKQLRYLDLHNNSLVELPLEVYELTNLEYLDISSNKLSYLSKSRMVHLTNLKLVSLKNNRFKYLPPVLGELPSLNLIEVVDNPLVLPPLEMVQRFQKQLADLDWVKELKNYLITNTALIESKIYDNSYLMSTAYSKPSSSSTPQLSRSKSISDTKTKASKAARRMGLIIKKPEETNKSSLDIPHESDSNDFPSPLNFPNSTSSMDSSFNLISPPLAVGTTISSTSSQKQQSSYDSPPATPTMAPTIPKNNRSRSNTLIEIDRMLENNDNVDTEHKLSAYFKRLSTLAEIPSEPISTRHPGMHHSSNPNSGASSRNGSLPHVKYGRSRSSSETDDSETTYSSTMTANTSNYSKVINSLKGTNGTNELPRSKQTKKYNDLEINSIVSVSRKVLFAFSELHSSVRRFSGFCVDKKVTIKMVSLLYTAKSNIDSLVENLELTEESPINADKIIESLHACITSFKSILSLLGDNFQSFVSKIDICFIRMLYLTVYASFSEIFNAYKLVVPTATMKSPMQLEKPKPLGLSINTNMSEENEEVDHKLYDSIDIATSKAQDVFGELTRAISKSAIASANSKSESGIDDISPQVAAKVKELTTVCVSSMDIIRRLKTKLITIRNNPSYTTKKLFWDDTNLFLKAIIQTFSSVKNIMKDLPILNEIRSSMATLTKSTKDVTILLEASSYKSMSNDYNNANPSAHPPTLSSIPSVSNIFTPLSSHPNSTSHTNLPTHMNQSQLPIHSHSLVNLSQLQQQVRTPLVAALGPAAQAILPLNSESQPAGISLHQFFPSSPAVSPGMSYELSSAPPQSSGQYFASNGINPFDGLIMANREGLERQDG